MIYPYCFDRTRIHFGGVEAQGERLLNPIMTAVRDESGDLGELAVWQMEYARAGS